MILNKIAIATAISIFLYDTLGYKTMASMSAELLNKLSGQSSMAIEMLGDLQQGQQLKQELRSETVF
jgi:hypothetical protein